MAWTFVSGATGGIGKAFAEAVAKKGGALYLTARSFDRLNTLKTELQQKYPVDVKVFACDLTSEAERALLVADLANCGIKLERIIHVAGVDTQKAFLQYSMEKLLFQLRVNVEATLSLTLALLPYKAKNTEVITISSMSGVSPMPYFAVYSATKAMLTNLFTALHYELKKDGVKVTTVLPGGVPTREDVCEAIKAQGVWGKLSAKSPEFVAEKSLKAVRKNKVKYIPGFFNKFLYFIMKIAPKGIVLRFIAKRWSKQSKDAF